MPRWPGLALCAAAGGLALWSTTAASPPAPGPQEIVNPKDGLVLVLIPAGPFTMGDDDHARDEAPRHRVTLPAYYIGKFPVTNGQFRKFIAATGHKAVEPFELANGRKMSHGWDGFAAQWGDDAPVVDISWRDAVAYCKWAGLRLPTEAEWEKAARGTEGRIYPWGDDWDGKRCRHNVGGPMMAADRPAPVASYPTGASPFGVMHMAGNVWQWCSSKYKPYPYKESDGREDLTGDDRRVARGGAWNEQAEGLFRTACRYKGDGPDDHYSGFGFRVARNR